MEKTAAESVQRNDDRRPELKPLGQEDLAKMIIQQRLRKLALLIQGRCTPKKPVKVDLADGTSYTVRKDHFGVYHTEFDGKLYEARSVENLLKLMAISG